MTVTLSSPLQLVISGIIGIADFLAAIEGRSVVGRQRKSVSPVKPPAEIKTPLQIGLNSTIAEGTF
jgi:hypothetical protein